MASHAALASSRIPTSTRLPSKTTHSFPAQCFSKVSFLPFSCISCVNYKVFVFAMVSWDCFWMFLEAGGGGILRPSVKWLRDFCQECKGGFFV